MIGSQLGAYRVLEKIGEGGMGEVYRATDTNLGRPVAIKVLPAAVADDLERLTRFEREARTLAALNHPNIAQIYGLERSGTSTTALVMELVEGPTLADAIAQGPIALDDALPIARQIADALEAAHDQGIVHRDLKPANIKVRPDGTVKVLDFGLAKVVGDAPPEGGRHIQDLSPTITSPALATGIGVLLGTAAYMSPEQARGKAVDKRADIWAFGCVLFEMVTGRRAFGGDEVTDTLTAIMRDQPDLSLAPAPLRRLLDRCLEKDPRRRLRDIGDAWSLVGDADDRRADASVTTPWWRRALPWAAAGAAAAAAVAVSIAHFTEGQSVANAIRFHIPVPVEAGSAMPALSPDGTRLAYRAGGQVWVRDLGRFESTPIATIDQSIGRVFWSADGRFVIYGASKQLLQVPAGGGPPQPLRALATGVLAGGVSLPGGGMLVANTLGDTLRVDATGERALTGIAGYNVLRSGISLLPDGKRVVYSVFQPEAERGIYVASIDQTTPAERVLPDASQVAYIPAARGDGLGYLLLIRDDALMALPVGEARLESRGEPIVIAQGVDSFSAAAGTLLFRAGRLGRLTWYDRQGTATGTAWSPGPYNEIRLSPDGARVAVVRAEGPAIWIHEFAREASVRLVLTEGAGIKPVWSPGGDRIVLLTAASGLGRPGFVSVAAGGGGEERVLDLSNVAYPNSWSADGRWLMYTTVDPRTKEDLWVTPLSGAGTRTPEPFLVTDNRETDAAFSPDGRSVAYVSDESGTSNVYVRSFPASGGRKWLISTAGGYQPRWRGDGKELFYIAPGGQLMSVDVTPGLAAAPARPKTLFQTAIFGGGATLNNWYWDVTSDGQRFLINTNSGRAEPGTMSVVLNWQSGLAP